MKLKDVSDCHIRHITGVKLGHVRRAQYSVVFHTRFTYADKYN